MIIVGKGIYASNVLNRIQILKCYLGRLIFVL